MPIARSVEAIDPLTLHGEPKTIELHPARGARRDAAGIAGVEQQIRIAAGPVAPVSRVGATMRARQVTDAKRKSTRKCPRNLTRRALDGPDERGRPVPGPLACANARVPFASIGKRDCVSEVPLIGCPNGDRLPC